MKKITLAMLKELHACQPQVRKFMKLYPNGFSVTKTNVIAAAKAGLDVTWAAWELMGIKAVTHFNNIEGPTWREWARADDGTMGKRARAIAQAAYRDALAKAFVEGWKIQCATKEKP